MGDLYYGMNNIDQIKYPSANINKDSIEKYVCIKFSSFLGNSTCDILAL
jgi:hypothetical protein